MASKKILIQIQVGAKDANIAVANVEKAMQGLSDAQIKVNKNTKNNTASAGLHNAILMESGRLASDLNYGFTAIANNLGQLFSLFQASANSAEGLGAAFSKLLSVQALFLIGGQLVIQNLDKITAFFKDVVFGIKDFDKIFNKASDTVKEVNGNFELYIATLEDTTKSEEEKTIAVKKLNEEYPDYIKSLNEANVTLKDVENKTKAATKQNDLYRDSIMQLAIARAAENELEKISAEILQAEIDLKNEQIQLGFRTQEEVDARIKQLDLLIKAEEADEKQLKKNVKQYTGLGTAGANLTNSMNSTLAKLKEEKASLEGTEKAYGGLAESTQERIKRLKEERELYIEFIDLRKTKVEQDKKDDDENTIKLNEGLFDKILKDNIKLENIRAKFNAKSVEDDFARKDAELKAQENYQIDLVNATSAFETEKEQTRLAIQIYYAKLRQDNRDKEKEAIKLTQLAIVGIYGKAIGSMGKLFKQGSDASKAAALTEIGINTALGFIQGLDIAQKSAKAAGPLAKFAFPLFYAEQIAAVLGAASQAKQILSSDGKSIPTSSGGGFAGGDVNIQAPDFNVVGQGGVNQLGQVIGAQFGQPLRAYVVSGDITTAQELDRSITTGATIG
jgi:hypothetical protein